MVVLYLKILSDKQNNNNYMEPGYHDIIFILFLNPLWMDKYIHYVWPLSNVENLANTGSLAWKTNRTTSSSMFAGKS